MEIIRGNGQQRLHAQTYLYELRSSLPYDEFSKKTINTRFDLWLNQLDCVVNTSLFNDIVASAESQIQISDPNFQTLPFDRYVVGTVATSDIDTGGFNSRYSRGFKYLANAGFGAVLNSRYTNNRDLVTAELARSYLHDCIHAASFRTIRELPSGIESKFPIYREQYGLNFRRADGSSYSQPYKADESPDRINLGVLMDGVTVLMTAEELKPYTSQIQTGGLNDMERIVLADINLDFNQIPDTYRGKGFHEQVTVPTQKFLALWGGDHLYDLLKYAMLTGKMKDVVKHFDCETGMTNSWARIFKASSY